MKVYCVTVLSAQRLALIQMTSPTKKQTQNGRRQAMKKYIISIFALAAAVACSKMGSEPVQQPNSPSEKIPGIEYEKLVVNTGAETKTSLNGTSCAWSEGDSFSVFADQTDYASENTFSMTGTDSFEGEVPVGTEDFYAVYGTVGSASGSSSSFTASVTISNTQAPVANSFDPKAHVAVAHGIRTPGSTEPVNVTFSTFNRLIKITVPANVTSVVLSSNTAIAGTMTMNCTSEGTLSMTGNATANSVTLSNGGVIPEGTYYLCVAPVNMEGFQMVYTFTDGSTYTKSSTNTLQMAASNQIRNLTLTVPMPTSADLEPAGFYTTYSYGTGSDGATKNVSTANGMAFSAVAECGVKYNNGWGRTNNDGVSYNVDGGAFTSIASAPVLTDWKSYEIRVKASLGCQEVASGAITRHITGLPYRSNFVNEKNDWNLYTGMSIDNNGMHFFTATGSPKASFKKEFYAPATIDANLSATCYKQDKILIRSSYLKIKLGSKEISTKECGKDVQINGNTSFSGKASLSASFDYGGANFTADAIVRNINIIYQ